MIPHNRLVLTTEDRYAAQRVLDSGHLAQGCEVTALEHELAERFRPSGAAVCVANGTTALYLALEMTSPVTKQIISTYGCSATYHASALSGHGVPELSDVFPDTFHPRTRTISEHTFGVLDTGAAEIEDFTHAPFPPAGSIGTLSVISLGATKPLSAGGGGAVLGPRELIEDIRDRRDYDGKRSPGARFNWQMSDLHAAIGRSRLRRLSEHIAWRQETAERYGVFGETDRFWYRYAVEVPNAYQTIVEMAEAGVEAIVPVERYELLHVKFGGRQCSVAEWATRSVVSLPIWVGMTEQEVETVAEALRRLRDRL